MTEIKYQPLDAAHAELRQAAITFNSLAEHPERQAELEKELEKAKDGVHTVMASLNSKSEALHRVWCAQVGCFYYLFRHFFVGPREDTFARCLEYIKLALASPHVTGMIEDIAYSRDIALKGMLFSDLMKQKQVVKDRMKNLLGVVFGLGPPPSCDFPMLEILFETPQVIGMSFVPGYI